MIAELYIIAESFEQNKNISKEEIESKTKSLAEDFIYIKKYKKTNRLLIHPSIYDVIFINNISISDLMFNNEKANENLERDVRIALKKIILESEITTYTTEEVKEVLLQEHDENLCYGLIGFNQIDNVESEKQIVYNLSGWFEFKRYYLSLYPKNGDFFINECQKYFPNLKFHERNKKTIVVILENFTKKIIYHLSALNDRFTESKDFVRNRTQVLSHFSGNCNLDEVATLEGNASRKPDFTFVFTDNKNEFHNVCCEPHIKLCKSDIAGDNTYHQHRIYFHEGFEDISNNNILVGHIGEHL